MKFVKSKHRTTLRNEQLEQYIRPVSTTNSTDCLSLANQTKT